MGRIDWDAIEIGDKIKSLTEWCRQTGVDRATAYRRINDLDWPEAQAVGLEPRVRQTWAGKSRFKGRRDVRVAYRGEEHTLKEWHEISKTWDRPIPYRTLVYRFNEDYEPEDLFDTRRQTADVRNEKKRKEVEGVEEKKRQQKQSLDRERKKRTLELVGRISSATKSR